VQMPVCEPFPSASTIRWSSRSNIGPKSTRSAKRCRLPAFARKWPKNELRPVLNLILSTYVSGLEGNVKIGQALSDQFNLGGPRIRPEWFSSIRWGIAPLRPGCTSVNWNSLN